MPAYLLLIVTIIILGIVFKRVSTMLGIPMLLAFIILGMIFGSDGLVKIPFSNFAIAQDICSIALIFIMFYGGFGTKWSEAKPIAAKAILLASFGVIFTAIITALFCHYILNIEFLESLLIGSLISSTDAASVFSILRNRHLNLKDNTASLLEVESGSNDPTSYMLTVIVLALMNGNLNTSQTLYLIFAQFVYGILFGFIIAYLAIYLLKKIKMPPDGFNMLFVLAIMLFSYALPTYFGGNGYLSTYIVGIYLGNSEINDKKSLVNFFDGVTALMQMLLFFMLGLLAFPSKLPDVALSAFLIALFLTFIARPISVFAILIPFKSPLNQQLIVAWAGLRGAASIAFAVMATIDPASTNNDVFHIIFFIVLFSILFQGSLLPFFSRKLNMIDDECDVMKTFTDYSDEVEIRFIEINLTDNNPWINKKIKDINFPADTLLTLIIRGSKQIIPYGDLVLNEKDKLVISAKAFSADSKIFLTEKTIYKTSAWHNKKIADLQIPKNLLIIMIKRDKQILIPDGSTTIIENDVLVLNHIN